MKRLQLFFFLLLSVLGFAQRNALLYEIQSPNGKTSYVYGTIHLMDAKLFSIPKKLEKALTKSSKLCMEIGGINQAAISPDVLFDKQHPLSEYFTNAQMDSIYSWANANLMMNKEQFNSNFGNAKPFLLLQFMIQSSMPTDSKSYEKEFERMAEEKKIPITGLESVDQQLKLFTEMPSEQQVKMVMGSLRDTNSAAEFTKMQQIYLTQNLDELYAYVKKEKDSPISESRAFLEDRNINWIPQMKKMMAEGSVFFAIGAAHLAGDEGVLKLLEKEGYTITPIRL